MQCSETPDVSHILAENPPMIVRTLYLVVQENEELFSNVHPDMMFQHIAVRKGDNKINYSLKELVVNGLRTDIDRIVVLILINRKQQL